MKLFNENWTIFENPISSRRITDIFLEIFARLLNYKNIPISMEQTVGNFLPPKTHS